MPPVSVNNRFLKFSIDHLNSERVAGWCFSNIRKSKPVQLTFFIDDVPVGSTIANSYREDLKSYRMHPDGHCGFDYHFPDSGQFQAQSRLLIFAGNSRTPLATFASDQIPQVMTGALPRIFFMHIPKTGGTTLNAFATRYFPQGLSAAHIEVLGPGAYPRLAADKHYLAGHLPLEKITQYFVSPEFDLITLVRDPYRQLHSHLRWIRKIAADRGSNFFLKHEECVRDLAVQLQETDLRVKPNLEAFVDSIEGFRLDFFDNLQTRYFLDYRPDKVTPDDLQNALTNAKRFALIGVLEHFDDFGERFCRRYGITAMNPPRAFNRLPNFKLFDCDDQVVRSVLLPLVQTDMALYRALNSNN